MDRKRLLKLWADEELCNYIRAQARRHFSNQQDQEDACAEAWERIVFLPNNISHENIKHAGYRAIHALYERERRRKVNVLRISKVHISA